MAFERIEPKLKKVLEKTIVVEKKQENENL